MKQWNQFLTIPYKKTVSVDGRKGSRLQQKQRGILKRPPPYGNHQLVYGRGGRKIQRMQHGGADPPRLFGDHQIMIPDKMYQMK